VTMRYHLMHPFLFLVLFSDKIAWQDGIEKIAEGTEIGRLDLQR
jgi:hypothetical protein